MNAYILRKRKKKKKRDRTAVATKTSSTTTKTSVSFAVKATQEIQILRQKYSLFDIIINAFVCCVRDIAEVSHSMLGAELDLAGLTTIGSGERV